jgi:hypothetical protein
LVTAIMKDKVIFSLKASLEASQLALTFLPVSQ